MFSCFASCAISTRFFPASSMLKCMDSRDMPRLLAELGLPHFLKFYLILSTFQLWQCLVAGNCRGIAEDKRRRTICLQEWHPPMKK